MPKFDEDRQKRRFEELREKEAEDLAKIFAGKYGITYIDLSRVTIDLDSLKILTEEDAREGQMAVFQSVGKKLQIAVKNPDLPKTKQVLEELKSQKYIPQLFLVSENSLDKALSRYPEIPSFVEVAAGIVDISPERLEELSGKIKGMQDLRDLLGGVTNIKDPRKATEVLDIVLAGALALEASDVHIEPGDKKTELRFRMDGFLQDVTSFGHKVYELLNSRIKLVSEIKINIKDRAQDGRFTIRTKQSDIEVRTSVLPGPYGESIVMRVLHPRAIQITLENLGMRKDLLEMISLELKRPNGMILTTGPTGSGKTTTLYAFVKKVNGPGIKIITIEDPIEYHLEGITQSQVDPDKGYDFSNGLRSIVRQDPDIILVGEIRDQETAEIAMHAALTGHLVFSTLHTNDAAGTIPRLIDLGVKPNIIAPAINVSMAQRLVRQLCKNCAKKEEPSVGEKKLIEETLKELPKNIEKPNLKSIFTYKPAGCEVCGRL
jgi:type II secretory ATPase GspE/PulE/Tfp pilus assembly ATPase PilB-like protein